MVRVTKTEQVKQHLLDKKSITSWEAINFYGATRLSAIIFNLRDAGFNIETKSIKRTDRNGNPVTFGKYILVEKDDK